MKDTGQKQATKYKSKSGVKGPSKKLLNSYLIGDARIRAKRRLKPSQMFKAD